jgi:acyl-CoA synthetase (AMP-forming)/AMP-acid ligase II
MSSLLLSDLNACSRDEFVAALGNVFEYSPWIAEQATLARPFDGVQQMFDAMKAVVDQTAPELRLARIRGHPDLANKTQRAAGLTAEALDRHCLDSPDLANFKRPRRIVFVAEIPKTASGKILRRLLRDGRDTETRRHE